MEQHWLGLDLGGSSLKGTLVQASDASCPKVLVEELWPLGPRSPYVVTELISAAVNRYPGIDGIGLAVPGIIDRRAGTSEMLPNFPSAWRGFPLSDTIEAQTGRRPALINDAKAFSVAETALGAGRGGRTVASVVLGTGVGGALVHDGVLFEGSGTAGEFGHIVVEMNGSLCGCGNRGCVEAYAGADAIRRSSGQASVEAAWEAALRGDERAAQALDRAVTALACAMASIFVTAAPDLFVVGGGQATAGDVLLQPLTAQLQKRVRIVEPRMLRVVPGSLGRSAGSVGAALFASHVLP